MLLHCKTASAKQLSNQWLLLGNSHESVLHITVDEQYVALGLSVYAGCLQVLICDDTRLPDWYPIECFALSDDSVPPDWLFRYFTDSKLQALWGYRTLVANEEHYDALLYRDENALRIFYQELNAANERLRPDNDE